MGWYMVKSGLVDVPQVSQYRLTAHLSLAVVIIIGLLWVAWDLLLPQRGGRRDVAAYWCAGLVFLTMLSGGFVAGTDAGLLFGTWPLMGDRFFPAGLFASGWTAAFEDPVTIQFDHRMLAYLTTGVLAWFAVSRFQRLEAHRLAVLMMVALLCVQICLGIVNILLRVPVSLAAAHQAVAVLLLISLCYLAHRARAPSS